MITKAFMRANFETIIRDFQDNLREVSIESTGLLDQRFEPGHLVQDAAKGPDVGPLVETLSLINPP